MDKKVKTIVGLVSLAGVGILSYELYAIYRNGKEVDKLSNPVRDAQNNQMMLSLTETKVDPYAEVKAKFSILDNYRNDGPGTRYVLEYPFAVHRNLYTGLIVEKIHLLSTKWKYNSTTGSDYLYDFREIYHTAGNKSEVAKLLQAENANAYVDRSGKPLAFQTIGVNLMLVRSKENGKIYIVPVFNNHPNLYQLLLKK